MNGIGRAQTTITVTLEKGDLEQVAAFIEVMPTPLSPLALSQLCIALCRRLAELERKAQETA